MKHKTKVMTAIVLLSLGFMAAMIMLIWFIHWDHTSLTEEKEGDKQFYEKNIGKLKGSLDAAETSLEETRKVLGETENELADRVRQYEILTNRYNDLETALENEQEQRREEQKQLRAAQQEAYYGLISRARGMIHLGEIEKAQILLGKCPSELRSWEWGYLSRVCTEFPQGILLENRVAVFHDVCPQEGLLCGEEDGEFVMVFSVKTGKLLRKFQKKSVESRMFRFSGNGEKLYGFSHKKVHEAWLTETWEYEQPSEKLTPGEIEKRDSASPDGTLRVRIDGDALRFVSAENADTYLTLTGHPGAVFADFLSDEKILSASGDGLVKVREFRKVKTPETLLCGIDVRGFVFLPEGRILAVSGEDKTPAVITPGSGDGPEQPGSGVKLPSFDSMVRTETVSSDGSRKAVCSGDTIYLLDGRTGTRLLYLKSGAGNIHSIAFSPDGKTLAAAAESGLKVYSSGNP